MTARSDIERLFRSNYKAMLMLAIRLTHDQEVARDIVHDVFASVLTNGISSLTSGYLLQGVRFACLKYLRNFQSDGYEQWGTIRCLYVINPDYDILQV